MRDSEGRQRGQITKAWCRVSEGHIGLSAQGSDLSTESEAVVRVAEPTFPSKGRLLFSNLGEGGLG